LLPPFTVVIHNGLLAYVVATSAWIVICTGMSIQLLPPFAVVIHNSLLAYVVAIPAAVVICVGFQPHVRRASCSPYPFVLPSLFGLLGGRLCGYFPRFVIGHHAFHCMPMPDCSAMASVLPGGFVVAPFRLRLGLGVPPPLGEWISWFRSKVLYRGVSSLFRPPTSSLSMILVRRF
jgi:hypothetical protein